MTKSDLELAFLKYCRMFQLPEPEQEYRFHKPRQWRFDFAWAFQRVAVEVEGGTWANGRHNRGSGYAADCEKYNQASMDGWTVLRFTGDMVRDDPMGCIETVKKALEAM